MSPVPRVITVTAAILLTGLALTSLSAQLAWGHLLIPPPLQTAADIASAVLWCVYADACRYVRLTRRLEAHQTDRDLHSLGLQSGQQHRRLRGM